MGAIPAALSAIPLVKAFAVQRLDKPHPVLGGPAETEARHIGRAGHKKAQ